MMSSRLLLITLVTVLAGPVLAQPPLPADGEARVILRFKPQAGSVRAKAMGANASRAEALSHGLTGNVKAARMLVAVISKPGELERMADFHATMLCKTVWVVHQKGRDAFPSDAEIRIELRSRGYVDNKTSAVSDKLTATRYVRR